MANDNLTINPSNVTTGGPVEGACAYADFSDSPAIPTDATTSLTGTGSTWENVGELSDQGWTISTNATVNKFKGYHGTDLLSETASVENTLKLELVELARTAAAKVRYGAGNVSESGGVPVSIKGGGLPEATIPIVIDALMSNGYVERTVFPRCKAESVDDEAHQKGALRVWGMTFSLLADEDGQPYYKYRAKIANGG